MNIEEISKQLTISSGQVEDFVSKCPEAILDHSMDGKWTILQNLDHLVKSLVPLNKIMGKPKISIRLLFGKPNRPVRDYEGLVQRYEERLAKLEEGAQAPANFRSDPAAQLDKETLLKKYRLENTKLQKMITKWSEKQLDKHLLPHPLLGKILMREALYFTNHHTEHHLANMKRIELKG